MKGLLLCFLSLVLLCLAFGPVMADGPPGQDVVVQAALVAEAPTPLMATVLLPAQTTMTSQAMTTKLAEYTREVTPRSRAEKTPAGSTTLTLAATRAREHVFVLRC